MTKDEIFRTLQELGYSGKYVYIAKSHPDQETPGVTKAEGIIADLAAGMPKGDVSKKYSTCLPYINRVLLEHKKGKKEKKRKTKLSLELWQAIVGAWRGIARTGGYVYVPVAFKGDLRASENGLKGRKTALLIQEFKIGNFNARELAQKLATTVGFVYKSKSIWLKRKNH